MTLRLAVCACLLAGLAACGPNYSPDTYATSAVQQANKVEQGVIVGVRKVGVSASGTTGTVSGAAAGGIAGAQVGMGPISALSALGGSLIGGVAGSAVEHATADTEAYEYIVRKPGGELVSVTQKDKTPLALGLHVLVIAGNQARIVPDYTVAADLPQTAEDKPKQLPAPAPATVVAAPPAAAAAAAPSPVGDMATTPANAPSPLPAPGSAAATIASPASASVAPAPSESKAGGS
ncbi:MAG: hypothetical protein U1E70_26885 [Acetobacteraceae bacterium]|nr:hypothetical protein [Pseudomonadota bacterium]